MRSADGTKDQTYYLSSVPEAQLSRVSAFLKTFVTNPLISVQLAQALFPLAGLKKTEVRELAKKYGLPTASRQESMGVCFIGERGRFGDFICAITPFRIASSKLIKHLPSSSIYRRSSQKREHRHAGRSSRRPTRGLVALHHRAKGEARRDGSEVLRREERRGEERGVGRPRQVSDIMLFLAKLCSITRNRYRQQPPGVTMRVPPRDNVRLDLAGPSANGAT